MEMNQIRDIVKEVLAEVLTKELHQEEEPKTSVTTKAPADRRTLAKENIARWLGREAAVQNKAFVKPPPPTKQDIKVEENKSLVPNARKPEKLEAMLQTTPARVGVWRAGTRYLTKVALKLRADHAVAKDAVYTELKAGFAESNGW